MKDYLKSNYYFWNDYHSKEWCQRVINYIDSLELTDATVVNWEDDDIKEVKPEIRVTKCKLIELNREENDYERMLILEMWRLIVYANVYYNFNIDYETVTIQLGKYTEQENSFYKPHQDDSQLFKTDGRKISMSTILQNSEEGGAFKLDGGCQDFNGEVGSTIAFPSFFLHEVTPVTRGNRYSIVTWVSGPPWA
tara:strand:- start:8586 stop:9167 length:582 start_codon:yes stop_codon:yes gene_type:complete